MSRLLRAVLPPTLALVGLLLVAGVEKAHRVDRVCPTGLTRVVARCGGTAPGPLEPRYLLVGALGGAALGVWIVLASAGRQTRPLLAGVAVCLTIATVGAHQWADAINQPTMNHGTVQPGATTITPTPPGGGG